ncbi:MAG: Fic family protein [Deltaproteobacteria bacterium]|nr:Fic family protein [Deltaproteobacteria bacterium]
MMTLKQFASGIETLPAATSWYLSDIGESRGRQDLSTRQAPQRLKVLREHALIESAVSSNRIEGVTVEQSRVQTVVFGRAHLRDRDEEEVRGYRDALRLIHEEWRGLPVTEDTVKRLHAIARGEIWDSGRYKEKDGDIIERYPDGRERVRFKPVSAVRTPDFMAGLTELWNEVISERRIQPLIALAAFNLDFLCVHPFRDGNGRVSRLLMLLQCYHSGYEVGRFISLERLIEQNKERYYETLELSSRGWHDGRHDPWHYINFLLFILKSAYKEFEERVGSSKSPRGEKTGLVVDVIERFSGEFRVSDIQKQCLGVSVDLIRLVLKNLRAEGKVECLGRGQNAQWRKRKNWK